MSISYLLVVLGLAVLAGAIWALFWAIDSGQYDDLERHGADALENGDSPHLLANGAGPATPEERTPQG